MSELGIALNGIKNIKERYPHFELEIEQGATRTPVLIKQERKKIDWLYCTSISSLCVVFREGGRLLDRGRLLERGV